jgi:membrane-associated phospholipid phosphatase
MAVKKGLLAVEWIAIGYLLLTLLMMAVLWDKLVSPEQMIKGRITFVLVTLAAWGVYWLKPCRLTMFLRIAVQMVFLSWWYPDTYELNRMLPNLDHIFAGCEQAVFGCQPALLFAQKVPWGWFSELMCMGYISYFPMMTILLIYYFFYRYNEFLKAAFVLLGAFFIFYVIFIFLPVTGPQFYYLAVGPEKIAAGVFPNLGDWFLTHSERMAVPGWTDGFFYHLLEMAHNAGERPTAAFPSSHVGITTVVMLLAHHTHCRKLVLGMLPFYILMCLSTVYILAHYAIDALTGLFTGVVLYFVLIRLSKRFT